MTTWIDISVPLQNGMVYWPDDPRFHVQRVHDMNTGAENNLSEFQTCAHVGTHMDAPLHFIKTGAPIDQIPFDAVIGPARVIEIRDRREIPVAELQPLDIQPGERLLFK